MRPAETSDQSALPTCFHVLSATELALLPASTLESSHPPQLVQQIDSHSGPCLRPGVHLLKNRAQALHLSWTNAASCLCVPALAFSSSFSCPFSDPHQ